MAIVLSEIFHKREQGHGNEYWYRLGFDTDTGRFFVHEDASVGSGGVFSSTERQIELGDFLQGTGSRQAALLNFVTEKLRRNPDQASGSDSRGA